MYGNLLIKASLTLSYFTAKDEGLFSIIEIK